MITAIAPSSTTAPTITMPILHLDISDFHHDNVTQYDHDNDHTYSNPTTCSSIIKETTNVFRANVPQCKRQKHRDHRQDRRRGPDICSHHPNLAFDSHAFTDSK